MISPIKAFIVTSDTDSIEKFLSKKTANTYIIDLSADDKNNSASTCKINVPNAASLTDIGELVRPLFFWMFSEGNRAVFF